MKIAMVVSQFPAIAETFVLNQITGLLDRGHEVDVFAVDGFGNLRNKYHADVDHYNLLSRTHACDFSGIASQRWVRAFQSIHFLLFYFQKHPIVGFRILKEGHAPFSIRFVEAKPFLGRAAYDVVHCQFTELMPRVLSLRRFGLLKGRLVVSMRSYDISGFLKEKSKEISQSVFKGVDLFLPISEFLLKRLLKIGCPPDKATLLRSGIHLKKFSYAPKLRSAAQDLKLITVSRLVEIKGCEFAIRAVKRLLKNGRDVSLNIVGDGPLKNQLERLTESLDLKGRVSFLGAKTTEEVIELLRDFHVFVAPSVTATNGDQDGPPNTLKEAMAVGLPVISTRHGAIPEIVEDGISGFLVPERDEDAIAQKVEWLMEHPDHWEPLRCAGRARVEHDYDAERLNDKLVSIYRRLL